MTGVPAPDLAAIRQRHADRQEAVDRLDILGHAPWLWQVEWLITYVAGRYKRPSVALAYWDGHGSY